MTTAHIESTWDGTNRNKKPMEEEKLFASRNADSARIQLCSSYLCTPVLRGFLNLLLFFFSFFLFASTIQLKKTFSLNTADRYVEHVLMACSLLLTNFGLLDYSPLDLCSILGPLSIFLRVKGEDLQFSGETCQVLLVMF